MINNTNKYFGPGLWFTIHSIALTIKEEQDYHFFIKYMDWIKIYFPCEKCRDELKKYLDQKALPEMEGENMRDTALSCFVWTFHFHNHVNKRLNKTIIDINDAYDLISKYIDGCGTDICKL